jgi:hypothetical protein
MWHSSTEEHMRVADVQLNQVYTFTKSGADVRVIAAIPNNPDTRYKDMFEVERLTSGKRMVVPAASLDEPTQDGD